MKRIMTAILLIVVAVCGLAIASDIKAPYSNSYRWEWFIDTTVAVNHDTITGVFKYTGLGNYSTIEGYIYFAYNTIDTGTSASEIIDTTRDSLIYRMITYGPDSTIYRVIEIDSIVQGGGGAGTKDTVFFSVPVDSGILDVIQIDLIQALADSDYSVARTSAGVTSTVTVYMVAKK